MTITKKPSGPNKPTTKKKTKQLKKAPQAPKRFKSSYILFFIDVQEDIKKSLPAGQGSAPEVSKKASEIWKNLNAKDRQHWDDEAAKEKQRYLKEKELYKGPWQVPHKRAKKDPGAPKRNPSAFLLFSLTKRSELKKANPDLKNTEISRVLGELWRNTSDDVKRPFVEKEELERQKYKLDMSAWREKKDAESKEEKKRKKLDQEKMEAANATPPPPPSNDNFVLNTFSRPPPGTIEHSFPGHSHHSSFSTPQQGPSMWYSHSEPQPIQYSSSSFINYMKAPNTLPPRTEMIGPSSYDMQDHRSSSPDYYYQYDSTFHNHGQHHPMTFPDHSTSFHEHSRQHPIKYEGGGADSPYSYTEVFEPEPINH